jgi:MSHA biogenesis protein MshE
MAQKNKVYIAEILLEKKLITKEQLDDAILKQKTSDKKIGQILVESRYVKEDDFLNILSEQLDIPYINIKECSLSPSVVKELPEFYARNFRAIVLKREIDFDLVGMVDPLDLIAVDEIERILKKKTKQALIKEDDLLGILDNMYRRADEISHFAESLSEELDSGSSDFFGHAHDLSSEDMPVVNLLRSIFEDAVQINASDVHIEPGEKVLRIRLRVDGVLEEQILEEKPITQALVQRIKLMSGLNIAEKRLPQDGRFGIHVKNKQIDVRVSTMPLQYGEAVVMRLLNQSNDILKVSQIGMSQEVYRFFSKILMSSYGLLLIVGPTGSGKTTTLYAALNELNQPEDKIITVEDPIEYRLPRINQVQVNAHIGLTFANILRTILRQDPDIIMIGELRDHETAEIAIRSAMTGHFVLGTLHTQDTINTAVRLMDMGIPGYLVASVLRAVLAQRLVRKICAQCETAHTLSDSERVWLASIDAGSFLNYPYKRGQGCSHCHNSGYLGRLGVYELLPVNGALQEALRMQDISSFEKIAKQTDVYRPLTLSALDLAVKGLTSIAEVISMAGEI